MITGATAGIGYATAVAFANAGWNIIATGRRQDRLKNLASSIPTQVHPLVFDIQDATAVQTAIDSLPPEWRQIGALVNNAGLALGRDTLPQGNIDDWDQMIDTNIKGLLYVSKAVLPGMIERGHGHVINVSSIAGKQVYRGGNVYCATKHAVDALCQAMRIDMLPHGIRVTSINPGMVETEFSVVRFKGDTTKASQVYDGLDALQPEDIADAILYAATRPAHVNINEVIIMPTAQADAHYVEKKSRTES